MIDLARTPDLLSRLPQPPGKIALVKAARIGDFICATPAFRALRRALPQAEIVMVTLPLLRDLVERSPHLDRFTPFPGFPGIAQQFFEARSATAFFAQMQAEQFDLAIQMQGSGVYSNPFALMLGARFTAGFVRHGDAPGCLDAALPLPDEGHEVKRMLALSTFLGAREQGLRTEYVLLPEDHEAAEDLLSGVLHPLIALHAGAWDEERRWPLSHFVAAGKALRERYGGSIVLIGGPQEERRAAEMAQGLGKVCLNLVGKTALGGVGAVLCRTTLLVTNDSGPAHMAYALGIPTITVCNGSEIERYGPLYSGPFHMATPGAGNRALAQVEVAQVVAAVDEVLHAGSYIHS